MHQVNSNIPKIIWILWYQGLSEAPVIVQKCVNSWIKLNPTWQVIVLSKDDLDEYIRLDLPEKKLASLPLAKRSNLIRLQLLSEYGGVWADATTLCVKPLDCWVYDYTSSGFFAFSSPGPDRLLSTFFLASEKGCPIVTRLRQLYVQFFSNNNFNLEGKFKQFTIKIFKTLFNNSHKTTKFWFNPIVTKIFRVYPYFVCHYLFERLVAKDPESRDIWQNTEKLSADLPLFILKKGFNSDLTLSLKNQIDINQVPLYKLKWKYDLSTFSAASLIYYILGLNETDQI